MKLNRLLRRDIMKYVSCQKLFFTINSKKKPTKLYKCNNFFLDTPSTSFF